MDEADAAAVLATERAEWFEHLVGRPHGDEQAGHGLQSTASADVDADLGRRAPLQRAVPSCQSVAVNSVLGRSSGAPSTVTSTRSSKKAIRSITATASASGAS